MMPLGAKPATLRRATGPTTYVDGVAVPAATVDYPIYVSFQPMGSHQMMTLPEGDRERDPHKGYTTTMAVNTVNQYDGTPPDLVVVGGIVYQVRGVNEENAVLPNSKLIFLRVQETVATGGGP